jgi:sirohydrochlorin cobaltochelatase
MTAISGPRTGLLLVGHGTRSAVGVEQFLSLARRIARRLAPVSVEPAFLELQQPDIPTAVARLVEQNIHQLVTLPLLLFAAGHAKLDIPQAVNAALAPIGATHIQQLQAAHLGCHPALVELSERRTNEISPSSFILHPSSLVCLLLVGRGSHDESATAEMHEFARLRAQKLPGTRVEVAFLAMARPLLADQLATIAREGQRHVIVQPHLLFDGELIESISRQVATVAAAYPQTQWHLVAPLADPPGTTSQATKLIEKVILDRCQGAGIHVVEPVSHD